jgi:hypothetical protein
MKLKHSLQLLILSTTVPTLSATVTFDSLKSNTVVADEPNPDSINISTLLNGKTLSETFTTAPSTQTLIRAISTDYPQLSPYTNQLEFGTQTANNIQVRAYA